MSTIPSHHLFIFRHVDWERMLSTGVYFCTRSAMWRSARVIAAGAALALCSCDKPGSTDTASATSNVRPDSNGHIQPDKSLPGKKGQGGSGGDSGGGGDTGGGSSGGGSGGSGSGGSGSGGSGSGGSVTPPAASAGSGYHVEIGGYYFGQGSASVGGDTIHIVANVHDEAGNTGQFVADVSFAKYHFKGTGTMMGYPVHMVGRMDPPDTKGAARTRVLRSPRITCTFEVKDGSHHHGRLAGEPNN